MNSSLRTQQEAQQWLDEQGLSKAEVARRFNVTPSLVDAILRGLKPCKRGASHNIAVFLGLKVGQTVANKQTAMPTAPSATEKTVATQPVDIPKQERHIDSKQAVSTEHATLLVVDDSINDLKLMAHILGGHYTVKTATQGKHALEVAASVPLPDLILLDIHMPGMDGYEVCRRLKSDAVTRDIPVIFLTASDSMEDAQIGLEIGAVDYITKPVRMPILLARVKTQLTLKAQADLLRQKNMFLAYRMAQIGAEISAIQDVSGLFDAPGKRDSAPPE